ncbi:L-lactate permease [Bacillus piscicola]|uniref:L-lactate permease n=1 Tax=Bacillus piscicola TaxID=1632684 RepID=UPI001F08D3B4|nr:L-lactate permease [Bacillus piscicola]
MDLWLLCVIGVIPIMILFLLLVVLRWTARTSMLLAFISVLLITTFVWQIPVNQISAASVDGVTTVFSILYIVFGALLLLNTLKESGALGVIRKSITGVTQDRRIQVIILLWVFGAFLEGAAGYGSTGAVVGSILVALGFPAMSAALMVMIFQSTAVSFGAAGAPIWIGVSDGLGSGRDERMNSLLNVSSWDQFLLEMGEKVALIHGAVGIFVPLFMVVLLCGFFGKNKSFKEGFGAWKFAIFGGLCVSVPYILSGMFLGPEFPSLFGGLLGLIPAVIAAKKGWFMPKDTVWQFGDKSNWEKEWIGVLKVEEEKIASFSTFKSWLPYIIMAALLFISNVSFLPVSSWLGKTTIVFTNLFGTDISTGIDLLASPGTVFVIVSILTIWLHGIDWPTYKKALKSSIVTIGAAAASLIFAVPMVQVFLQSGGGAAGFESIPSTLASGLTFFAGNSWAFIAPVIGAMGAFLAGSNVFSNLMFSQFQVEMALSSNLTPSWVVALQCVGAAAGNMFSVHNVIMASAAVGLVGKEGNVIRKVIIPASYYILMTGAIGYVLLVGVGLNLGSFVIAAILGTIFISIFINKGYYKQGPHLTSDIVEKTGSK